jgi:hypothetical protein
MWDDLMRGKGNFFWSCGRGEGGMMIDDDEGEYTVQRLDYDCTVRDLKLSIMFYIRLDRCRWTRSFEWYAREYIGEKEGGGVAVLLLGFWCYV